LFQVLFALYVAQKEYEFVHNDLHKKNILLVEPSDKNEYSHFCDEDCTWFTTGLFVKITDFGLSRIRLDNQRVLYNKKRPETEGFSAHTDLEKVIEEFEKDLFRKISSESWETFEEVEEEVKNSGKTREEAKVAVMKRKKKRIGTCYGKRRVTLVF